MPLIGKFIAWPFATKETPSLFSVHNLAKLTGSWRGEGVIALSICMEQNNNQDDE